MTNKSYVVMERFEISTISDEARATKNPQHSFYKVNGRDLDTGVDCVFDLHIRNRPIAQVGATYKIDYEELPEGSTWTPTINTITPLGGGAQVVAKVPNPASTAAPVQAPAPTPPPAPQATTGFAKPDLGGRFTQWNTNHRTAMMQATERVRMKVDLVLAGKLYNDQGEVLDGVKESVLTNWIVEEFNNYWALLSISTQDVEDGFGKFGGS